VNKIIFDVDEKTGNKWKLIMNEYLNLILKFIWFINKCWYVKVKNNQAWTSNQTTLLVRNGGSIKVRETLTNNAN
jgi:hypothetical protein